MKITAKLQKRYDQIKDGMDKEIRILKDDIAANEKNITEKNDALAKCIETGGASSDYVKYRRSIDDSKLTIEGDTARLNHLENSVRIDCEEVEKFKDDLQKEAEDVYQKARLQIIKHLEEINQLASDANSEIKEANAIMKKICIDLYRDSKPNEYESKLSKRENDLRTFLYYSKYFPERIEK